MSELLGKYYDEKTTKLFELVINKLLKKKYQWFDRIIINKLSYSKNQNYLGVDARLFADEDWVKNQWGKFYYSKPMPSGTQDDPILFEALIGGELSKKLQDYFKDVFVIITSEKTPKYMSWSWIEAIPVEMNDKNLQENILRIKEVMGLNEQFPEGIDTKDLEAKEVPIDNVQPEETPNEEEPKDSDDFSNSVVPQIVWRAGRVGISPKGGGIWFGETKKDVENFAWSVRDEKREGLPYYINLQNPKYYKNFWNDYLRKAKVVGRDVLMNALMNAGYDGIIIDTDTWNDTADEYAVTSKQFIVFDPKNVKPA